MRVLSQNFRTWWQPPRKAGDRPEHRQVTFLELFYDLVYVVLIAELSHALSAHISWGGPGGFVFLFVIVWNFPCFSTSPPNWPELSAGCTVRGSCTKTFMPATFSSAPTSTRWEV